MTTASQPPHKAARAPRAAPARLGQARAIAEIMPDIGRAAFRRFGFVQSSVVTRWPEIVGAAHARVSCPQAIRFPLARGGGGGAQRSEGVLELLVESAHAPLIAHIVPEIIARVNRFFGYRAVAKVKIHQGRVTPPPPAPPAGAAPMLRPAPLDLGDSLRDIGDPELQAVLASLAQSLASPKDR